MNDAYILRKDHLKGLLRKLKKDSRLVAPVKNSHGDTMFMEINSLEDVQLDLTDQAQASAKPFLLPQQETLFRYKSAPSGEYRFEAVATERPTIFFGLRSCDLSAILYMDVIFLRSATDPYYLQKRRNTVLINLVCDSPFENCFCNATKNGPYLETGYDLQFTDLGDRYYIEVGRTNGGELVKKWRSFFSPVTEKDVRDQYQVCLEARTRFKQHVAVDQAIGRIARGGIPDSIWSGLSQRCQDCGGCAFICPTCTCFTITDRPSAGKEAGERVRSWDACTFSGFTRMAGNSNPIDRNKHAVRKRFMHKLRHDVIKHGRPSCVGCGRCVGICFGGVDIIRFINEVCEVDYA